MALEKKPKLCLVEVKQINIKDKQTNIDVPKFKYTFFDESNAIVVGYADKKMFTERIMTGDKYDPSKAFEYAFEGRVWEDKVTWRLVV